MKHLFYIILILLPLSLICQNTFELKIKTDIDDIAIDILQCADGSYIFVGSSTDNVNIRSQGIIYKISPQGNIIDNIEINRRTGNEASENSFFDWCFFIVFLYI